MIFLLDVFVIVDVCCCCCLFMLCIFVVVFLLLLSIFCYCFCSCSARLPKKTYQAAGNVIFASWQDHNVAGNLRSSLTPPPSLLPRNNTVFTPCVLLLFVLLLILLFRPFLHILLLLHLSIISLSSPPLSRFLLHILPGSFILLFFYFFHT